MMRFEVERTSIWEGRPCSEAQDIGFDTWVVDFETLEAFMVFVHKYNKVVIKTPDEQSTLPIIEIYDTWRE